MVKLVLQHKQIDNVNSRLVKESHDFFKKYDFSAFSFDAAHDYHNDSNFCIYSRFNCVLMNFSDIIWICSELFLCSCQYTQQNGAKQSNALQMKRIRNTRGTTNNHHNCQNKQEYCI